MRPAVDIPRLRLALASLELWLCELAAWLVDALQGLPFGRVLAPALRAQVRADLARAEDGVRGVVVLLALRLAGGLPPEPPRRGRRPCGPPPGFARAPERGDPLRHVTRPLRLGGRGLAARIARLRAVIAHLDAWAERLRGRLAHARRGGWRLRRALADALASLAQMPAPAPDTS